MPTQSRYDICSAALLSVGARRIASFDETTSEAIVAAGLYDVVVDTAFSDHRWNFARSWFALNRIYGVTPPAKFSYLYQLPADCVLLRNVVDAENTSVEYQTARGRQIATSHEAPIAFYTSRLPEEQWPGYFSALVVERLAAHFYGALFKRPDARDVMLQKQNSTLPPIGVLVRAMKLDEQEQSAPQLPKGPVARAWGRR